jgi:hypothetical protein
MSTAKKARRKALQNDPRIQRLRKKYPHASLEQLARYRDKLVGLLEKAAGKEEEDALDRIRSRHEARDD